MVDRTRKVVVYILKRKSFTTVKTAVFITDGIFEHVEGLVADVKKIEIAVSIQEGNKQVKLPFSSSRAHYYLNYHQIYLPWHGRYRLQT